MHQFCTHIGPVSDDAQMPFSLQSLSLALHAPSKIRHANKFLATATTKGAEEANLLSGQTNSPRDRKDGAGGKVVEDKRIQKITDDIFEVSFQNDLLGCNF